jgi:hypothetical protein
MLTRTVHALVCFLFTTALDGYSASYIEICGRHHRNRMISNVFNWQDYVGIGGLGQIFSGLGLTRGFII